MQMQTFGCFRADSEPPISCRLHASFAISIIALTLVDYLSALVLVLLMPRLLVLKSSLAVTRCVCCP